MRPFVTKNPKRGGTWPIIYIDLLTNMMIFFVILWSISNTQARKNSEDAQGDIKARYVSLPSDVLFEKGSALVSSEGQNVFQKLFGDKSGDVLNFNIGGLSKRMLVIHGHTDGDGTKFQNFELGFRRAYSTFQEINKFGKDVPNYVTICSHADNLPAEEVPQLTGKLSPDQLELLGEIKRKNRRIAIEDKILSGKATK